MKKILLEALLVAIGGATLAFAANALSPYGLKLTLNYFPGEQKRVSGKAGEGGNGKNHPSHLSTHPLTHSPDSSPTTLVESRLREKGLGVVDSKQVAQLFEDPRSQQELIVFIDARNDEHYMAGHIPGAYQFDHYHPDKYLSAVIPACQQAQQIVVYCKGGECEDSEFAALMLRDSVGIAKEKLFVYAGGITDWEAAGHPLEIGPRKSGQMRAGKK